MFPINKTVEKIINAVKTAPISDLYLNQTEINLNIDSLKQRFL